MNVYQAIKIKHDVLRALASRCVASLNGTTVSALALLPLLAIFSSTPSAQQVSARISSKEAYVGSPIVLQIQIVNAKKYSLPETIDIKDCEVRQAGAPSQSSQITIISDHYLQWSS